MAARGLLPAGLPGDPRPLDFAAGGGTLSCLVGPRGCGKTAWLRCLAAIDPPVAGTLSLDGCDCGGLSLDAWRRLRLRAAFLGPTTPLLSVLGALANVMLPAQYHRLGTNDAIRRKAFGLLERLGWEGPLDALPAHLSRHQRRLLALARCLILDPVILFVDEPFDMSDVDGWHPLADVFAELRRDRGLTQIVITHHLPFVHRHADRILFACPGGLLDFAGWAPLAASDDPDVRAFLKATDVSFA
ncbi:MAG: ATP-binding cassette domain-containing protein [Gammaproteobacteria bacterium]|nr:ATP-binding cassette domain-containing protein [Gammaproteobacteria bacterium]